MDIEQCREARCFGVILLHQGLLTKFDKSRSSPRFCSKNSKNAYVPPFIAVANFGFLNVYSFLPCESFYFLKNFYLCPHIFFFLVIEQRAIVQLLLVRRY